MQKRRQYTSKIIFSELPQKDLVRIFIDKGFLNKDWRLKQRVNLRKLNKFWNMQCNLNVKCIPEINPQQIFFKHKNENKLNHTTHKVIVQEAAKQFPNLETINQSLNELYFEDFSDFLKIRNLKKIYLADWDISYFFKSNNNHDILNEFREREVEFYIDNFFGDQHLEIIQTGLKINFLHSTPQIFTWSETIQLLRNHQNFNFLECQVSSLFEELVEIRHRFKSLILPYFNGRFILRLVQNNPNLEKISILQSQQINYSQFRLDDLNYEEAEQLLNELQDRELVRPLSLEFETQQILNVPYATQLEISSLNIIQQEILRLINGVKTINIAQGCSRRGAFSTTTSRKFEETDILNEQLLSLENLQELNIYRKKFWHSVDFSKLTKLTKLTLTLEKSINSPELEVVQKLVNLKELELRSKIPGPCKIDKFQFLNGLKKLRHLRLYDVRIRQNKMNWKGLDTLKNLQSIVVEYSSLVDWDLQGLKQSILKAFPEGDVYVRVDFDF